MSHSPDPQGAQVSTTKAVDPKKWVRFLLPLTLFSGFCVWYLTKDTQRYQKSYSTQTYKQEESSLTTIIVSQLSFNSQGYSVKEISEKTQIQFDVEGYQFDIDGTAKLDDVCTIKNGKVINGTLPEKKEYYIVTPLDKKISLIFKKQ